MKKIIATFIATSMIFSFTGCNLFKKTDDPTIDNSSTENKSDIISSDISSNISSENSSDTLSDIISDISSNAETSSESIEEIKAPVYLNYEEHDFSYLDNLENECKGWGQGHQVDEYNRPVSGDIYNEKYGEYGGVFIMPNTEGEKKIYLTFDEGYENGYTTPILDALLEKNVKAVFFVTGYYAKKNPELIQRMIDEGHIIGNHGMGHKIVPNLTNEEAFKEISSLHNYMVETYNYNMTLFRPPEGKWSTRALKLASDMGYKSILWSYAYKDYDVNAQIGADKALPKITKAAHNGAIYLLHAVSKDNAEIMGDFVDNLQKDGYEFCLLEF